MRFAEEAWNVQWTLLDAAQKRCAFVEQVAEELGIKNVRVVWARAEAAGRDPSLREVMFQLLADSL